jgi:nucleoside-diphosphate-sugar epimerase
MKLAEGTRKVLITGGAGYVGTRLVRKLIGLDIEVVVVDTFWYGMDVFKDLKNSKNLKLIKMDIRDVDSLEKEFRNVDAVIHLACISNDPSYDLNPNLGKSINFDCFEPIVKAAKQNGVSRFIYASSSSVYGVKQEDNVTEVLSLEPLTDYSKFKAMCEPILFEYSDENFCTTVLRPATVCGYSERQRLDLSVNILTNYAINKGFIRVFGGEQLRPNLHIEDMCDAYLNVLGQDQDKVNLEIFNVGGKNLSLMEIAVTVRDKINKDLEIVQEESNDLRSYKVNSDKIKDRLNFSPKKNVSDAIEDLKIAFKNGKLPNSFDDSIYFNLKRMSEIFENKI